MQDQPGVRVDPALVIAELADRAGGLTVEVATARAALRQEQTAYAEHGDGLEAQNRDLMAEVLELRERVDKALNDPAAAWQAERAALHARIAELEDRLNDAHAEACERDDAAGATEPGA